MATADLGVTGPLSLSPLIERRRACTKRITVSFLTRVLQSASKGDANN